MFAKMVNNTSEMIRKSELNKIEDGLFVSFMFDDRWILHYSHTDFRKVTQFFLTHLG